MFKSWGIICCRQEIVLCTDQALLSAAQDTVIPKDTLTGEGVFAATGRQLDLICRCMTRLEQQPGEPGESSLQGVRPPWT